MLIGVNINYANILPIFNPLTKEKGWAFKFLASLTHLRPKHLRPEEGKLGPAPQDYAGPMQTHGFQHDPDVEPWKY